MRHLGLLHSVTTSEITGYKQHNQESQSEISGRAEGHSATVPSVPRDDCYRFAVSCVIVTLRCPITHATELLISIIVRTYLITIITKKVCRLGEGTRARAMYRNSGYLAPCLLFLL